MPPLSLSSFNLFACKALIEAFNERGLEFLILCPGSRSSPLAVAANGVSKKKNLKIFTAIDERSAAFLALGISTASGKAAAVVTTSGTAVANLLPASVEADRSFQPLLLLTADRPERLKNCGANQTVNQEDFLKSVCRSFIQGPQKGIHEITQEELRDLVDLSWDKAHRIPGPVHVNLPLEEPLYPSFLEQKQIWEGWKPDSYANYLEKHEPKENIQTDLIDKFPPLDPSIPGVIIVGPWRGHPNNLDAFKEALNKWQEISGWPIFADPLSGLSNEISGLIYNWEFLLRARFEFVHKEFQVLRLGPLPASRILESWIEKIGKHQVLITEGDSRNLDSIGGAEQWSNGFVSWMNVFLSYNLCNKIFIDKNFIDFTTKLKNNDLFIERWIKHKLSLKGCFNEPSLAYWLPRLLPPNLPIMISASSPVRDWITYSGSAPFSRRCFSFRGASGIDGTLSLGMGLSIVSGKLVLVTGDLALLHDTNGWLFSKNKFINLIVILIDNGGGGIFRQLELDEMFRGCFEEFFVMPQDLSFLKLVEAYGISSRQVSCLEDLESALEWGVSLSRTVLIRVCTNSCEDNEFRKNLGNEIIKLLNSSQQSEINC